MRGSVCGVVAASLPRRCRMVQSVACFVVIRAGGTCQWRADDELGTGGSTDGPGPHTAPGAAASWGFASVYAGAARRVGRRGGSSSSYLTAACRRRALVVRSPSRIIDPGEFFAMGERATAYAVGATGRDPTAERMHTKRSSRGRRRQRRAEVTPARLEPLYMSLNSCWCGQEGSNRNTMSNSQSSAGSATTKARATGASPHGVRGGHAERTHGREARGSAAALFGLSMKARPPMAACVAHGRRQAPPGSTDRKSVV